MKHFTLISIGLLLALSTLHAQQTPLYSQYMFNMLIANPAYAGTRDAGTLTAVARIQWNGVDGAPTTQTFSYDTPIGKSKNMALGVSAFNDELGITRYSGLNGIYAYRIAFNQKNRLSLGLQAGVFNFSGDFTNVQLARGVTGASGIDAAFGDNINKWLFNVGVGAYYYGERFYFGLSAPQILNNTLGEDTELIYNEISQARQKVHIFLATGYVIGTGIDDIKLKPSLLIRHVKDSPIELDYNLNVWLFDILTVGVSFRNDDAIMLLGEWQLNSSLGVGYSYDFTTNDIGSGNGGTHEFLLRYSFGKSKKPKQAPRYF